MLKVSNKALYVALSEAKALVGSKQEIPRCSRNDILCGEVSI